MAVQWYCAPAMGNLQSTVRYRWLHRDAAYIHIEAISASDAKINETPIAAQMKPYTTATGPPSVKAGPMKLGKINNETWVLPLPLKSGPATADEGFEYVPSNTFPCSKGLFL